MGTNYYAKRNKCDKCGRCDEPLHIGKSSAGWCFSLHVIPEEGLTSLEAWREFLSRPDVAIENEYGDPVTLPALLATVTKRGWLNADAPQVVHRTPEHLSQNHAVEGPHGLMRHAIGKWCVGHGEGTWDYIPGEFS